MPAKSKSQHGIMGMALAYKRGEPALAIELMDQALSEARSIGSIWLQLELLDALVQRLDQLGHADEAGRRRAESVLCGLRPARRQPRLRRAPLQDRRRAVRR